MSFPKYGHDRPQWARVLRLVAGRDSWSRVHRRDGICVTPARTPDHYPVDRTLHTCNPRAMSRWNANPLILFRTPPGPFRASVPRYVTSGRKLRHRRHRRGMLQRRSPRWGLVGGRSSAGRGRGPGPLVEGLYSPAKPLCDLVYGYPIIDAYDPYSGPSAEVSFRPATNPPIDPPARPAYNVGVTAEAMIAELESDLGKPWSRTPALPPARAARPDMPGPRKLSYTHEDCIDYLLANPTISQNELAQRYGYTPTWISLVLNCDAFQAALAKRRDEVLSPEIRATVEEKFKALIDRSQNILLEQLHTKPTPGLALGVLGAASKALGYGARDTSITVNQSFVVALPAQVASSDEWAKGHTIEGEAKHVG